MTLKRLSPYSNQKGLKQFMITPGSPIVSTELLMVKGLLKIEWWSYVCHCLDETEILEERSVRWGAKKCFLLLKIL